MRKATIFKWPIIGFSTTASRENPTAFLNSGDFVVEGTGVKLALQFYPTNAHKNSSRNHSSLYLILKDLADEKSITLEYRIWMENTRGEKHGNSAMKYTFEKVERGLGCAEFIHHDKLYAAEDTFVKDDLLFLCCKVRRLTPTDDEGAKLTLEKMREKLWELQVKGSIDKCIIRVGDKEFPIAKNVLMLQSEALERMLLSNFKEGKEGAIVIDDFDADVVGAFIKYLHLQTLEEPEKFADPLFSLADKYDVQALKAKCSEFLCRDLNSKNILRRLTLAFMHDDNELKTATLDHVTNHAADGNFRSILKSPEWKRLACDHPELADQITDAIFEEAKWLD